jgi:hypothetical protein
MMLGRRRVGILIAVLVVYVSAVTIRGVDARRGRFDDDDANDDRRRPSWYGGDFGDNDDDDTKRDMMRDFSKEFMDDFSFDMVNETTGERIRGGMGIVAPTFDRDTVLVGVFLPSRFVDGEEVSAEDEVEISVCEFSKPENCLKEVPYPGAPDDFACGLSDETLDDTGFDCDTGTANLEPDGDLSVEMEVSEEIDDEDRFDDYDYAASPSPAPSPAPMRRRTLLMSRFGRANPRRSRTLRTTGARGYSRG